MDGELSVCTITANNQFLEGPLYQESIYTGASENIEYCSAPAYIHSSYYNDAGMFQESWTSYPQNINANFYAYEEESYWDGTYMHYEISESENSYEVSEEERNFADRQVSGCINELVKKDVEAGLKVGIICCEETLAYYEKVSGDNADIKVLGHRSEPLSMTHELFRVLREFDDDKAERIYAESYSDRGVGFALMNRMRKAAGMTEILAEEK
jgi:hypothetical protein